MVLLEEQDRSRWDRGRIEEGLALAAAAVGAAVGPYALQAAIAAEHSRAAEPGDTDWGRIRSLNDRLAEIHHSPVVELASNPVERSFLERRLRELAG